jgi:peptidoglycan/LPS O-acetylase OafA/YrhL
MRTDSSAVLQESRLTSVDGLRGLSIAMVMLGHAMVTIRWLPRWLVPGILVLGNAGLGVSFFFVISGYLITHLLLKEFEAYGKISFYNFYVRRVTRIFPAFYIYLIFLGALSFLGLVAVTPTDLIVAGSFLWNYLPVTSGSWWLGQTWSLCIEEQFYLLWPATLVLLGRKNAWRVALFIVCAEPAIRVLTYLAWPSLRGWIPVMLHTRADILMFGCLLALSDGRDAFYRVLNRLSQPICLSLAAIFVFLVSPFLELHFRGAYVLPIGFTLEGLSIAVIVFKVLRQPGSAIARILKSPPLVWTGIISYSLYLWQQLFLTPMNETLAGIFPISLLFAYLLAATSYYMVERPILQMRPRWLRTSPKLAPPAEAAT